MSFYDQEIISQLSKSKEIGKFQPVIIDADTGNILIGNHRKKADPDWPEVKVKVKDELHRTLIILCGNIQRKPRSEETKQLLEKIGTILISNGTPLEKVCSEISKLPGMPYSLDWIEKLLFSHPEWKMRTGPKAECLENPISRISDTEEKVENITTALSTMSKSHSLSDEPSFPYSNCKCKECDNKGKCY